MTNNPKPITSEKEAVELFREKFFVDDGQISVENIVELEVFIKKVYQSAYSQGEQVERDRMTALIPRECYSHIGELVLENMRKAKYLSEEDKTT